MQRLTNLIILNIFFFSNILICSITLADNHNIYEQIELIRKDIKTLEKAVYSGSVELNNSSSGLSDLDGNSEDVLTRHLLKLSEIENQFQQLTNKFEEINFKLDKLSNRLSKVQADNQLRFQNIESGQTTKIQGIADMYDTLTNNDYDAISDAAIDQFKGWEKGKGSLEDVIKYFNAEGERGTEFY